MTFGRSILLFATVVCAVLVPLFVGHGLASRSAVPFAIGGGLLALAAVGATVLARGGRGEREGMGAPAD